jgi:hypothetical protein
VRPPRRPAAQVPQESALTKRRFEPARGPAASIGSIACYSTFSYGRDPAGDLVGVATRSVTPVLALTDQHLDVVGEFTATGTVLSGSVTCNPLGVVTATSGMIGKLGYQSGWTAPVTANVNMGSRWYSPATGQFLSGG